MSKRKEGSQYIPDRGDIIWLDFEPTKGKEIGKYRPTLVLSSKGYSQKTGLMISCPISTSIRGHNTEVPIENIDQPSVVATTIIQTLDWKNRKAKFIAKAEDGVLSAVYSRILPLIGADKFIDP